MLLGLLAGAAALPGCGNDKAGQGPSLGATTVEATEYKYLPPSLTVPANVTLTIKNVGTLSHTYILKGQGIGTADISPGKSRKLNLAGVAPGTYTVFCDIPGHEQAGQVGSLTITP